MKKILVADDEDVLRMLIVDTLEDEAYEIEEAENGKEALRMASEKEYDLLVVDYMMPGYNGVEVLSHLKDRDRLKQMKSLMLTAKSQESDRESALKAGATEFLTKPFSPALLISVVEDLLDD